ncbi:MAG: N-acetylmuramoyl-L-alanine amidase [Sumerlaeia bacterium]
MNHITKLLIIFLALPIMLIAQNSISDVRSARFQLNDRIVVETTSTPTYKVASTGTMGTVMVDFFDVSAEPRIGSLSADLALLKSWKGEYFSEQKIYRLYLKHEADIAWSAFTLKNPNRLVLDFSRPSNASFPSSASQNAQEPPRIVGSIDFSNPSASPEQYNAPRTTYTNGFRPRTIIVDAGHGGHHRGGIGSVNGKRVTEADVTPPIANELFKLLSRDSRFKPEMTRTQDVYIGLRERTRIAEQKRGNLFVSIHYNSVPPGRSQNTARGLEFWVWSNNSNTRSIENYLFALDNEEDSDTEVGNPKGQAKNVLSQMVSDALLEQSVESRRVATALEKSFLKESYFKKYYRGIKDARFKVLENYAMPSVLIEVGFISHPEEAKLSTQADFQNKVARLIYNGIVLYYETNDPEFARQVAFN